MGRGHGLWPLEAARRAQPSPAGLVGNVPPENKTKRQQRPSCALGSSLGCRRDSGVVVFPTTRVLK